MKFQKKNLRQMMICRLNNRNEKNNQTIINCFNNRKEKNKMGEFIEMVKLGASLGVGFYIGFEGLKALTETVVMGFKYILELIFGNDEEE